MSSALGADPPIAYRRVMVPANTPAAWPRDGEKFLPVEVRDFEAWLAAANRPAAESSIVDAQYHARLEGQQLVGTSGRWQVALRGEGPTRLPLATGSLVIQHARWSGATPEPAQLGWWPASHGPQMVYALQVPHSGELEFDWHVPTPEAVATSLDIPLRLPIAARTRLVLELPSGKRPEVAGGEVLESSVDATDPASANTRRWVIGIGESPSTVLRIVDLNAHPSEESPAATLSEAVRYDVRSRGFDLESRLRINVGRSPLSQLRVTLPTELQLIAATAGEQALTWRMLSADESGNAHRVAIRLPALPNRGELMVVLHAWGAVPIDESWRLPKVSYDGLFWTSGSIKLAIDDSLELCELVPVECIQTEATTGATSQSDGGQLRAFRSYSPQATVKLAVRPRQTHGRVRMATTLQMGSSGVDGRLVAEIVVDAGRLHALSADLIPGWSIDGVESVPADAIGEWYVDGPLARRTIEFQLSRAVTPGHAIRIAVTGRALRGGSFEPRTLEGLHWFTWRGLAVERNLLSVTAAEPFELEAVGELPIVAQADLTSDDRQLIGTVEDARWLDLESSSPGAAIRLAPRQGTYDAEIQLNAVLSAGALTESYRIDCRPRGSSIDHLLMYVPDSAAEPLEWVDAQSGESLVAERMPKTDPRLSGLPPDGELWQLRLRRLYARPVTIAATRTEPWTERRRVPLVALPDAAEQRGRVVIASDGVAMPTIVAERMQPTPLPPADAAVARTEHAGNVRAIFRYQPVRFYDAGPARELWVGPPVAGTSGAKLIATQVSVESHYTASGSGVHRVEYQLENQGAGAAELRLPSGVSLDSARIDGQPVVDAPPTAPSDRLVVTLPPGRRDVSLELRLESDQQPLSTGLRLRSPLPAGPLTILQGEWTIWLPQEFEVVADRSTSSHSGLDWRARIFGPLARPAAEQPFNPFARDDWNAVWNNVDFSSARSALADSPRSSSSSLPDGWHAYEVSFVATPPAAVTVTHPPAIAAWSLAIFLVCLVGPFLGGLRTTHALSLALAAAALGLLLPAPIAPLAAGAVLGLLSAPLWRWAQPALDGNRKTFVLLAIATLVPAAVACAQAQTGAIERVLVPVDSAGKPSGTKCFVGERFLRQLLHLSGDRQPAHAWLLHDVRCDGELATQPDKPALAAGEWTLTSDIEILTRDATIELPLVDGQADWPAAALVDGIATPITWDANGQRCSIRVAEPGHYRLSIPLRPKITDADGQQQIELDVPPVAGATVKLKSPPSLADLQVVGAASMRRDETTHAFWEGELDGSGRLIARWNAPLIWSADSNRRVEELLWLRVGPAGLELDVKFVLPGSEWPPTLALRVDPRWELTADQPDVAVQSLDASPAGRGWLRFDVPPATRSQHAIELRFRSRDDSPLGRLRVPTIKLADLPVENCLLGMSWGPAFECVPSPAAPLAAAAAADFASAWGAAEPAGLPQLVFDIAKLGADWNLAVRPTVAESTYRELISLTARMQRLDVVYQAEVTPAGADRFQWSLAVPPELAVDDVVADAAGKPVSLTWARTAPDRLNVFFAQAMSDDACRLRVVGSMRWGKSGRCPFPHIWAADRTPVAQAAALGREANVLADWVFPADPPASADAEAAETLPIGAGSRLVAAHVIDPSSADSIQIRVKPNQPKVSGATLTTLAHEQGIWTATLSTQFRVDRGELDTLKLRLPTNWTGPFEVTPPATTEVAPELASGRDAIVSIHLQPAARAGEMVSLKITSPLTVADGQSPAAPRIVPLTTGNWQRFLALPTSLNGEPVAWTRLGIEPASPPGDLWTESAPASSETFRIASDNFNVVLRPRTTDGSSASVRLAETAMLVGATGGRYADTRFVLVPQGLSQCVIELPRDERLVRITLDGHPALARPLDQQHWQAQLGPAELPQVLEVVTRMISTVGPRARFVELRRPTLTQADHRIPVDLSLWTFFRPTDATTLRASGASVLSAREWAALRLDRLVSIVGSASRSAIEAPVVDGYNWYTSWSEQLAAAERIAQAFEQPVAGATAPARVTPPNDDLFARAAERSATWMQEMEDVFADAGPVAAHADSRPEISHDPWALAGSIHSTPICLVADGGQDQLRLEIVPAEMSPLQGRLVALTSLGVVAAIAFWIRRRPDVLAMVTVWPQATVIVIGVAAWAWLRPSALGLLIAAVGVGLLLRKLIAARQNSAREKSPRHDNTRQPSSIPDDSA